MHHQALGRGERDVSGCPSVNGRHCGSPFHTMQIPPASLLSPTPNGPVNTPSIEPNTVNLPHDQCPAMYNYMHATMASYLPLSAHMHACMHTHTHTHTHTKQLGIYKTNAKTLTFFYL